MRCMLSPGAGGIEGGAGRNQQTSMSIIHWHMQTAIVLWWEGMVFEPLKHSSVLSILPLVLVLAQQLD